MFTINRALASSPPSPSSTPANHHAPKKALTSPASTQHHHHQIPAAAAAVVQTSSTTTTSTTQTTNGLSISINPQACPACVFSSSYSKSCRRWPAPQTSTSFRAIRYRRWSPPLAQARQLEFRTVVHSLLSRVAPRCRLPRALVPRPRSGTWSSSWTSRRRRTRPRPRRLPSQSRRPLPPSSPHPVQRRGELKYMKKNYVDSTVICRSMWHTCSCY